MDFKYNENSSCDIIFKKEEIEIIKQKGKLVLPPEHIKPFVQVLGTLLITHNQKIKDGK